MSQTKCPHCGFLNFAISAYCGRCERPLRVETPTVVPTETSASNGSAIRAMPPRAPKLQLVPPPPPPRPTAPLPPDAAKPAAPQTDAGLHNATTTIMDLSAIEESRAQSEKPPSAPGALFKRLTPKPLVHEDTPTTPDGPPGAVKPSAASSESSPWTSKTPARQERQEPRIPDTLPVPPEMPRGKGGRPARTPDGPRMTEPTARTMERSTRPTEPSSRPTGLASRLTDLGTRLTKLASRLTDLGTRSTEPATRPTEPATETGFEPIRTTGFEHAPTMMTPGLPELWRVATAALVDGALIACVGLALATGEMLVFDVHWPNDTTGLDALAVWLHIYPTTAVRALMGMVLFALLYSVGGAYRGRTLGRTLLGLQLVRREGLPVSWPLAVMRGVLSVVSVGLFGAGYFWMVVDNAHRTGADLLSRTVVVRR